MTTPFSASGWNLTYDVGVGGLSLHSVTHDSFSMAQDVRITRVWLDTDEVDDGPMRRSFVLGTPDLAAVAPDAQRFDAAIATNPSPMFAPYVGAGLRATFKSAKYLAGTPNEAVLSFDQTYLFTPYGRNPPHEPGAVLDAARIVPLGQFDLPAVKDPSKPYPRRIRIDYRVDVSLDDVDESGLAAASYITGPAATSKRNQAAIFRDTESVGSLGPSNMVVDTVGQTLGEALVGVGGAVVSALPWIGGHLTGLQALFDAYEKPVLHEVATWGLIGGPVPPGATATASHTWDNLHIWPASRAMSSTPGSFHALHCHWRWGAVAGDPSMRGPMLPAAGSPQFKGLGWSTSVGGPLIDSRIPRQNLQFAVTNRDRPNWAASRNPSSSRFADLFTSERNEPAFIGKGDDLTVWFSFEAFRDTLGPWQGAVFVNGMYFAHGTDRTTAPVGAGGAYSTGSSTGNPRKWERLTR